MSNWWQIKDNLLEDLIALSKDKPYPMIWIAGVSVSMLASLCYYDSANLVRIRNKIKQLQQQRKDQVSKRG